MRALLLILQKHHVTRHGQDVVRGISATAIGVPWRQAVPDKGMATSREVRERSVCVDGVNVGTPRSRTPVVHCLLMSTRGRERPRWPLQTAPA